MEAEHAPWQVRLALVAAPRQGMPSGKGRPVILIRQLRSVTRWDDAQQKVVRSPSSSWEVMGLTTKSSYADGLPREMFRGWQKAGLSKPSFFWSPVPTVIAARTIRAKIGDLSREDREHLERWMAEKGRLLT